MKASRHAGIHFIGELYKMILTNSSILGEGALETAQNYAKDSKKKATKKTKEVVEEANENAIKLKRKATEL